MIWALLIISLPTENATARMRAWRTLKTSGAAVLRDGVYLLPAQETALVTLTGIADDVRENGGTAYILRTDSDDQHTADFPMLFDRSAEYGELMKEIHQHRTSLSHDNVADILKQVRKLRKTFSQIVVIDFFAGEAQQQTANALKDIEVAINQVLSPNEPRAIKAVIPVLELSDYQGRIWATRARPWVDRLASAWLIRRFIDAEASILWLPSPHDCPVDVLSFDFDGATFSHIGSKVTFEVLLTSFDLESPAFLRLGSIVHFLDAGGLQPPEAEGVERVLSGLREAMTNDDQLLTLASTVFDGLLTAFEKTSPPSGNAVK
jgi:hypothetical protein